jgi:hypothetical protein
MATDKRWWHRYQGVCAHGIFTAIEAGGCASATVDTLGCTVDTFGCGTRGCTTRVTYVRSWDHSPSEAEVDAVMPEGYRDADCDLNDRCDECMDGRHSDCTDVEDESCCCPDDARHYFPNADAQ